MFTIARDSDNDIYLEGNGQIATVSGIAAATQIVDARVKTSMGELQLNTRRGVPYFATVLKNRKFLPYWESCMREIIGQCSGVSHINYFRYATTEEELQYDVEIVSTDHMVAQLRSSLGE